MGGLQGNPFWQTRADVCARWNADSVEQQHEPREFEGEDLSDAVFWGVDLRRALFRDADLTLARVFHA